MKNRITSINIQELNENEVFVFGSNLSGIHGGGAARLANEKFGAAYHVGKGHTGKCYALPTKDKNIQTLPLEEIKRNVDVFLYMSQLEHNKDKTYLVTEVGCGLAGYNPNDIAPFFRKAIKLKNIHLPESFWKILLK